MTNRNFCTQWVPERDVIIEGFSPPVQGTAIRGHGQQLPGTQWVQEILLTKGGAIIVLAPYRSKLQISNAWWWRVVYHNAETPATILKDWGIVKKTSFNVKYWNILLYIFSRATSKGLQGNTVVWGHRGLMSGLLTIHYTGFSTDRYIELLIRQIKNEIRSQNIVVRKNEHVHHIFYSKLQNKAMIANILSHAKKDTQLGDFAVVLIHVNFINMK